MLLLPALVAIFCGLLMRCGARLVMPTVLLFASTVLGYVLSLDTLIMSRGSSHSRPSRLD